MQSNQHGCLHSGGATEGQDEAHGAPDPEADEYEWNEDQLLVSRGGGGTSMQLAPLTDGPVFRERLVLCGEPGAKTGMSQRSLLPDHLRAPMSTPALEGKRQTLLSFLLGKDWSLPQPPAPGLHICLHYISTEVTQSHHRPLCTMNKPS